MLPFDENLIKNLVELSGLHFMLEDAIEFVFSHVDLIARHKPIAPLVIGLPFIFSSSLTELLPVFFQNCLPDIEPNI